MNSTFFLSMSEVPVAFGIVSTVEERVFCLLSAGGSVGGVANSVVVPVEFVVGLGFVVGKASCFGGFADEEVEYDNKQDEGGKRVKHESRGKVQALSFCQQLIQLWLRLRLKQQMLAKQGDLG